MKNNKIGILISKIQNLGPVNVVRGLIKENKNMLLLFLFNK